MTRITVITLGDLGNRFAIPQVKFEKICKSVKAAKKVAKKNAPSFEAIAWKRIGEKLVSTNLLCLKFEIQDV